LPARLADPASGTGVLKRANSPVVMLSRRPDWLPDAEHRRNDELHLESYEVLRAGPSDAS